MGCFDWLQAGIATAALAGPGEILANWWSRRTKEAIVWRSQEVHGLKLLPSWDFRDTGADANPTNFGRRCVCPFYPLFANFTPLLATEDSAKRSTRGLCSRGVATRVHSRNYFMMQRTVLTLSPPASSVSRFCRLSLFRLAGSNLIRSGLASLRRLTPDMNSLVSTGVLAVYLSSVVALCKPSLGLTATFHEPVRGPFSDAGSPTVVLYCGGPKISPLG